MNNTTCLHKMSRGSTKRLRNMSRGNPGILFLIEVYIIMERAFLYARVATRYKLFGYLIFVFLTVKLKAKKENVVKSNIYILFILNRQITGLQ